MRAVLYDNNKKKKKKRIEDITSLTLFLARPGIKPVRYSDFESRIFLFFLSLDSLLKKKNSLEMVILHCIF
jgi:hypothetical protein